MFVRKFNTTLWEVLFWWLLFSEDRFFPFLTKSDVNDAKVSLKQIKIPQFRNRKQIFWFFSTIWSWGSLDSKSFFKNDNSLRLLTSHT